MAGGLKKITIKIYVGAHAHLSPTFVTYINKTSTTKNSTRHVKRSVPAVLQLCNKDHCDQMFFTEIITVHSGYYTIQKCGARGGALGSGTALQTASSRVQLEFFINIILPFDSASNSNNYQEYFLWVKAAGAYG
jgi:hypothetical protein